MVKIGMIVDNDYQSDIRVKREAGLLVNLGYQVHVLCISEETSSTFTESKVQVDQIHMAKKIKNALYFFMNLMPLYEWWWKVQVKKFIERHQLQILHAHDLYMAKSVRYGIKATGKELPMILDLHENYPAAILSYNWTRGFLRSLLSRPKAWQQKEAQYLRYADRLVVLSEDYKKLLCQQYKFLNKNHVIPIANVVDIEAFDSFQIDEDVVNSFAGQQVVLYFGVVAERRGIFEALEVAEQLWIEGLQFTLLIIGPIDGPDKELFQRIIRKPGISENVIYKPWIDISELPTYMKVCSIGLAPFAKNPQHESGVANKLFQYMYGKLAILASDCKPQKELIEGYEAGLVFSSKDEFKDHLKYLLETPTQTEEYGHNGYEALLMNFHPDSISDQLRRLYKSLLY